MVIRATHLAESALHFSEMLHFVQHDMVFVINCVPSVITRSSSTWTPTLVCMRLAWHSPC